MAQLAGPLKVIGSITTILGKFGQAKQVQNLASTQQAFNEISANQVIATSQREALERKREAKILASRALAVAGGGASDPTVMRIISDIEGEGAYRASVELYEGEEKARKLRTEGALAKYSGEVKAKALKTEALGSALRLGTSMYSKKFMGTGKG